VPAYAPELARIQGASVLFNPGFILTIVTFPGVMAHELAHMLCCILTGTRVQKVCLFRLGNPAGYVVHSRPATVWRQILIGVGPMLVNTVAGFLLGFMAWRGKWAGEEQYLLAWLGISVGAHSFPSSGDAKVIWRAIWGRRVPLSARLIGTPLVGCLLLGALGSFFWLDLVYGIAVTLVLPQMMLR